MGLFSDNETAKKPRRKFAETFGLKRASDALDEIGTIEYGNILVRENLGLNERDDIWFDSPAGAKLLDERSGKTYLVDHSLPRNPLTGTWNYKGVEPTFVVLDESPMFPEEMVAKLSSPSTRILAISSSSDPTAPFMSGLLDRHDSVRLQEFTDAFGEQIPTPQRKENTTMTDTVVPAVVQAPATKKGILDILNDLTPADKSPQQVERENRIKAWQLLVADLGKQFVDLGGLTTEALEIAENLAVALGEASEAGTLAIERIADKNIDLPGNVAQPEVEKPKRTRRTKAEIEAEKNAAVEPEAESAPVVYKDAEAEGVQAAPKRPARAETIAAPEVDADDEVDPSQIPSDDADPDAGF